MNTAFELVDMPNVSIPLSDFVGSREEGPDARLPATESLPYLTRDFAEAVRDHIRLLNFQGLDADQANQLRERTLRVADALQRLWAEIVGRLGDVGFEAGRCRAMCKVALNAFDAGLESLTTLRNVAAHVEQAPATGANTQGSLNAAVNEVTSLRLRLALVLEQASAALAPLDQEKMQKAEAVFQQGEYTTLRDCIARRRPGSGR